VTVTKDETAPLLCRYSARLSNAECVEDGRLTAIQVDVQDTYGPTVTEAMLALDVGFETWRREQLTKRE